MATGDMVLSARVRETEQQCDGDGTNITDVSKLQYSIMPRCRKNVQI